MIKLAFLILSLGLTLNAAKTTTETKFELIKEGKDKYGNYYTDKKVTIKTSNYKVENFWSKLSFSGSGKDSMDFTTISKSGTVRMTMEATSLCSLYPELDDTGCSGQKPFLINSSAIPAYDANVSLIFNRTQSYSDYDKSDASAFYPLDVDRNEKFYKTQVDDSKSFFGFFRRLFSIFFGTGTASTSPTTPIEDIRQRYMANIVSGIDQDHLLQKNITVVNSTVSTSASPNPVAFIDYSVTSTTPGSCSLGFFKFSSGSIFCNFPFFVSTTPPVTTTADTIMQDTESSIIAFAGTFIGDNIQDYNTKSTEVIITENQNSGFFSRLKCFFFGCSKQQITVVRGNSYSFPNDTGITMTFAVADTNGTKIGDFETFKLLGVRSVVGEAKACKIDKDGSWFSGGDKVVYVTQNEIKVCDESGWIRTGCSAPQTSYESNSIQEWLTWCSAPGNTQPKYKGWFSWGDAYTFDTMFGFPIGSKYSLIEFNDEESKPSLVLDLKRIKLNPNDTSVKVRYQLMDVK